MLKEKMLRFIRENELIAQGSHVLAACSGGADSVCMLLLLNDLAETLGCRLSVVHVHHGLRGESADRDAAFTKALCERLGIPFTLRTVDVRAYREAQHLSEEEAARILRYQAIREVMRENSADRIAVAHHQEDQAETVLFHMLRGSGLRGLSGMQAENGPLIRPLLPFSREEILEELKQRGESWCEDESNADDGYTRNLLRNKVFPLLNSIRPDAAGKIAETAAALSETASFLTEEAQNWLKRNAFESPGAEIRFPAEAFQALHPVLRQEILLYCLRSLSFRMKDRTRRNILDMAAVAGKPTGKRYELPGEGEVVKEYDSLVIRRTESLPPLPVYTMRTRVFPYRKGMEIPEDTGQNLKGFAGKEYTKWFDYGKINQMPVLRTRQEGDRFSTRAGTHRKLKDYLIDEKVPRILRDRLMLAAAGHEVLWVIGMRMSEAYKVTDETEQILEITITGADDEREDQHFDF